MNQIFTASKLLFVPNKQLNPAAFMAFTVLLEILAKQGVSLDLCLPEELDPTLTKMIPIDDVNIVSKVAASKFIISFDKQSPEQVVKNIQWHQTDSQINLHVALENGELDSSSMKLTSEGGNYDVVLFFGVTDFSQVEKGFRDLPELLQSTKNISVGGAFAIPHGDVELHRGEQGETLPELIYSQVQGKGATPEHYSRLLAAILLTTNRFKNSNVKPQTFKVGASLMAEGANLARANSLIDLIKRQNNQGRSNNRNRKQYVNKHKQFQKPKQESNRSNRAPSQKQGNQLDKAELSTKQDSTQNNNSDPLPPVTSKDEVSTPDSE